MFKRVGATNTMWRWQVILNHNFSVAKRMVSSHFPTLTTQRLSPKNVEEDDDNDGDDDDGCPLPEQKFAIQRRCLVLEAFRLCRQLA
jgi:hypothetical protein